MNFNSAFSALLVAALASGCDRKLGPGTPALDDSGTGDAVPPDVGIPPATATLWIGATAQGIGDGSSYANRAAFSQLPTIVASAGPGTAVLLAAGDAFTAASLTLDHGGSAADDLHRVTVRGANADGTPAFVTITGDRPSPHASGAAAGGTVFTVGPNASHLALAYLRFVNVGIAIHVTASSTPVTDLSIHDIKFANIRQLLDVRGPLTSSVIADVAGVGFSKGFIELSSTPGSDHLVIQRVTADSAWQDGDWPVGVQIAGNTAAVANSFVTIANSTFSHILLDYAGDNTQYWQGDGVSTEEFDHHITISHVTVDGAGDAGFDLKSCTTVIKDSTVVDAKRSVRKHSGSCKDIVLVDGLVSRYPNKRGGTGGQAHVSASSGNITLTNSTLFDDHSAATIVLDAELESSGLASALAVTSGAVTRLAAAPLTLTEGASTATIGSAVTVTVQ